VLADLREAVRQLRKAPGVTTTAIVTLTLGIGATTAIFTLVHQVILKSMPVTKPEELWRIGDKIRCCNWGGYTQGDDGDFSLFSWEAYKNFRAQTPEFVDLAALQNGLIENRRNGVPVDVHFAGTALAEIRIDESALKSETRFIWGGSHRNLTARMCRPRHSIWNSAG
jgi:hypothetical protein